MPFKHRFELDKHRLALLTLGAGASLRGAGGARRRLGGGGIALAAPGGPILEKRDPEGAGEGATFMLVTRLEVGLAAGGGLMGLTGFFYKREKEMFPVGRTQSKNNTAMRHISEPIFPLSSPLPPSLLFPSCPPWLRRSAGLPAGKGTCPRRRRRHPCRTRPPTG